MDLSRFVPEVSWRWKVVIPLVGVTVVAILLLTYQALVMQRGQLEQTLRREGEIFAILVQNSLTPLIENAPPERLHQKVSSLAVTMKAKIRILNPDGQVVHSSELEEEAGRAPSAAIELARQARHGGPVTQRAGNWLLVAIAPAGSWTQPAIVLELDQSEAIEALGAVRRHVMAVAATWVVLMNMVVLLVLRVLVHQPVLELRHKISRARRGDWRVSVGFAERKDEIGELGSDFNDMVRQLRENCQQCEHLHNVHLQQAAHMASIGELAAGLAHEIKNPLAGIAGAIDVIRDELPENDPNRVILADVQNECRRIKKTISDLLGYATPQPPHFQMADVNHTVEHVLQLIEHQPEKKSVRVVRELDPAVPPLPHDSEQMGQVLRNLLLNALDAIEGPGEIRVATRLIASPSSSRAPAVVELVVEDNGAGMTAEQAARIFRPFFTTKQSGSGLGLCVSKRIVDQHGGSIRVESEVGRGTRFVIRLPIVPMHEKVFTLV